MSNVSNGLSAGMRSNLLLLQKTQGQVETIQNRLATGNKVNSSLDGPAAFFAAKGLTQRAGDLSNLKDAMGQAISTIKAGDKGISAIESLVEQARGLTTSAYQNLGNDPKAIESRKALASQFNAIKEQIDKITGDSGYAGKNLLAGNGYSLASTAKSQEAANSITGVSNTRVTNVVSADTYSIRVSGTGAISGTARDISSVEDAFGIVGMKISGVLSSTAGNFSDIKIEVRGSVGRERTIVITEGDESRSIKFFDDTQSVTSSLTTAGRSGTAQVSAVNISGNIEAGDTFTVMVNGRNFTYTASAGNVTSADPAARQASVATALRNLVSTGLAASGFTVAASGSTGFTIRAGSTVGTGVSFQLGVTAQNAVSKDISLSFSSGTKVSFSVDRRALDALGTAANTSKTIEKLVDVKVTATNLSGVSIERSANYERGTGKLADGENSLSFDSGTVRLDIDAKKILKAASAAAFANLVTVQRTDANTSNDVTVQFNAENTSNITVFSKNLTTNGQGLRLDYAQNGFMDRADIDKAVASLDYAKSHIRSASQSLSTNLSVIQTRENFSKEFADVLVEGANKMVQADQNEEGASLLLLQTRSQLATISLSMANQAQQSILRLF